MSAPRVPPRCNVCGRDYRETLQDVQETPSDPESSQVSTVPGVVPVSLTAHNHMMRALVCARCAIDITCAWATYVRSLSPPEPPPKGTG